MYKYINDYDKEKHEMRYIVNQYGVDVIVSKDILIDDQNKEIERLNNIINELEKWLKSKIDYFDKTAKDTILHEQMAIRVIYDYLQELKGDSSNE